MLRSHGIGMNRLSARCIDRVYYRVRTGPGKPGKSWNLIIWIPGLESHGILAQVLESHGISCWQICMEHNCLLYWIV